MTTMSCRPSLPGCSLRGWRLPSRQQWGDGRGGESNRGCTDEVSIVALAKHLDLDKSSVRARVRKAIERGYLINLETKEKQPARIALGDPLPNEVQILPSPEVLRKYSGAEGRETEGVTSRDTDPDEASSDEEEKSGKSPRIEQELAAEAEKSAEDDQKSAESDGGTLAPPEKTAGEPYPPDLAPLSTSVAALPDPEEAA